MYLQHYKLLQGYKNLETEPTQSNCHCILHNLKVTMGIEARPRPVWNPH
jgi:hypothetical protein